MMGILIDGPAWMFGDNQSVVTSSTIPSYMLNKRHNALSYHHVHEIIAFWYYDNNPSDIFTNYLGWHKFWSSIKPLLFWKGETRADFGDKPISVAIKELKEENQMDSTVNAPSRLRGVVGDINPSHAEHCVLITKKK